MRLVDADRLQLRIDLHGTNKFGILDENIRDFIDEAPTVDAELVTRCKDCELWDDDPDSYGKDDGPTGMCKKSFETMCADDFCSYGKRKDEANET